MGCILSMVSKFSIIICFMFVLTFGSLVSADEIQNKDNFNSIVISKEEYDSLLNRIDELESLKSNEINNNLLEYYEKSQADHESKLSSIFDGLGLGIGILSTVFFILGILNIKATDKALKGSENAVINIENKANLMIDKVEAKIEKVEESNDIVLKNLTENSKKFICENEEKVNVTIEKANKNIDELNKNIEENKKIIRIQEIYKSKTIADVYKNLDFKIKLYDKIISDLERENIADGFIYLERADIYMHLFHNEISNKFYNCKNGLLQKLYIDFDDITDLAERTICVSELKYKMVEDKNNICFSRIDNAISDLKEFINYRKHLEIDEDIIFVKMKLAECYLYKANYKKFFDILKDVNEYDIYTEEISSLIVSIIIVDINNYKNLLIKDSLGKIVYGKTLNVLKNNIEKVIDNSILDIIANIKYSKVHNNSKSNYIYDFNHIDSLVKLIINEIDNEFIEFNPTKINKAINELDDANSNKEHLKNEFKVLDDYLKENGNMYYTYKEWDKITQGL